MSTIFYEIFYFHQMIVLKNYKKMFLFHLKSSFHSRDIQICGFSSFPLFHCFTCWSKKNLKTYDFINSLNKNSITNFLWYLGKEIRYDIETLPIDRVLKKEHFYRKIMQKIKNILKKVYENPFKKSTLFFLSNPVPFNG